MGIIDLLVSSIAFDERLVPLLEFNSTEIEDLLLDRFQ